MISTTELYFLRGVCSDPEYPYYFIYQDENIQQGNYYRTIHVYLSKDPIDVSGSRFDMSSDTVYLTLVNDQYFRRSGSGEASVSLSSGYLAYTNTPDTPLYPDIYDSTLGVSREVPFDIPLLFCVFAAASLVGGLIARILFGGK